MLRNSKYIYKTALGSAAFAGLLLALGPTDARAQLATDVACARCIETSELEKHAVSQSKLAPDAVSRKKIVDGAVTAAKLAPDAVFEHIVVVRADPLDTIGNCDTLRNVLTGITDNDADNRYLIHLEPGTFDCDGTTLVMKDFVSIQGSGRDFTLITGSIGGNVGLIDAADNSELSRLSVENTGGFPASVVIAVTVDSASFRMTDVAVSAQNESQVSTILATLATITFTNVTVEAGGVTSAAGISTGINLGGGTSAELVNVTARAEDGAGVDDCALKTNIGLSGDPLVVRNSVFSGPDAACIENSFDVANFVSTQLDGATTGMGALACVGSYDGAFVALDANCN